MKLKSFIQMYTRELTFKRKNEPGYIESMRALKEVRDTRSYLPKYRTFEEFCEELCKTEGYGQGNGFTIALMVEVLEDMDEI